MNQWCSIAERNAKTLLFEAGILTFAAIPMGYGIHILEIFVRKPLPISNQMSRQAQRAMNRTSDPKIFSSPILSANYITHFEI